MKGERTVPATDLPQGWTWVSPTDVADPAGHSLGIGPFGSDLKVSDYQDSGVPLVFVRNIRSGIFSGDGTRFVSVAKAAKLHAHEVRPRDVLITKMGDPPGDSWVYPDGRARAVMTADCIRWRIHPEAGVPWFFAYATRTRMVRQQILSRTQGVAQKKVSLARFKQISYPLAPLSQQHRIVAEIEKQFTRLDAAVAALEAVEAKLKRARASVLKAAVEGRLVPTEAELARAEGRTYEPASILLERISEERRRRWSAGKKFEPPIEPNGLEGRPLPEGWVWATMDQLTEVGGGVTKNAKRSSHARQMPYLRVANVYANELRLEEVKTIGIAEKEIGRYLLREGDLLIVEGNGSIGQIGRVAVWDGRISPCLHQNHLIRARPVLRWLTDWALYWLLSPEGRRLVERVSSSTSGLHTLSISKVQQLPVALPPEKEHERIVAEVERRLSVLDALEGTVEQGLVRCVRLRQSILKRAFEGRLVPQDPADEPASELLARIRSQRAAEATA